MSYSGYLECQLCRLQAKYTSGSILSYFLNHPIMPSVAWQNKMNFHLAALQVAGASTAIKAAIAGTWHQEKDTADWQLNFPST